MTRTLPTWLLLVSAALLVAGGNCRPTTVPACDAPMTQDAAASTDMAVPSHTTIKGTVMIPAGGLPVPNAFVYVGADPTASECKTEGRCINGGCGLYGKTHTCIQTNAKGEFELAIPETLTTSEVVNRIPLTVAVGKWKVTTDPAVVIRNQITNLDAIKLPQARAVNAELPKIALATGAEDAMECLLRKIGISESEFGVPNGIFAERAVHVYQGNGGATHLKEGSTPITLATYLWNDRTVLDQYDMVLLACEGSQYPANKPAVPDALEGYLNSRPPPGGRVFATHFQNYWVQYAKSDIRIVATFNLMRSAPASKVAQLGDREHPVSEPFRNWLKVVNAIDEADRMELPNAHATIMSARNDAQSWLSITLPASMGTGPMTAVQLLSFRTPVGAATEKQTGRMVLADFHVTPMDPPGGTLFSRCSPGSSELTPQEKALAYMLFDLSNDPVVVPPG